MSYDFISLLNMFYEPNDIIEFKAVHKVPITYPKPDGTRGSRSASSSYLTVSQINHKIVNNKILQWENDVVRQTKLNYCVNPRSKKDGKKSSIKHVLFIYADVDGKSVEEAQDIFRPYYPPPNIVVSSGFGTHLEWAIKSPVNRYEADLLYQLHGKKMRDNNILYDKHALDTARVLRVPGSYHHEAEKYCSIDSLHPNKYSVEELIGPNNIKTQVSLSMVRDMDDHGTINPSDGYKYKPKHNEWDMVGDSIVAEVGRYDTGIEVSEGMEGRDGIDSASVLPLPQQPEAAPFFMFRRADILEICEKVGETSDELRRSALLGKMSKILHYFSDMRIGNDQLKLVHDYWYDTCYISSHHTPKDVSFSQLLRWYDSYRRNVAKPVVLKHPAIKSRKLEGVRHRVKRELLNLIYSGCVFRANINQVFIIDDRSLAKQLSLATHSHIGEYIKYLKECGFIEYERGLSTHGYPSGVATEYRIPDKYMNGGGLI